MKEISLFQYFAHWSPFRQKLIASAISGVLACFVSYIPVNFFGMWANNWLHWRGNLISVVVLATISYVVIAFKYGWVAILVAVVVALAVFVPVGMNSPHGFWPETWMVWLYTACSLGIVWIVSNYSRHLIAPKELA